MRSGFFTVFLLVMILFTSCINIEAHQKIKRDGKYDLSFTISTSEEFSSILDGIEDGLVIDESIKDKHELESTETSISHKFTDLGPGRDNRLFQDVNTDDPQIPDNNFLSPENFDFKKEFRFPYYVYTYTFKTSPKQSIEKNNESDENRENREFNDSVSEEAFSELFKMRFVVEVFGTIIRTDGEVDGNKVSYDLMMNSAEEHIIVFKDFFLIAWLYEYSTSLIIGILILLGIAISFIRFIRKIKEKKDKRR